MRSDKIISDLDVIDLTGVLSYKVILMGACFILAFARATQASVQCTNEMSDVVEI